MQVAAIWFRPSGARPPGGHDGGRSVPSRIQKDGRSSWTEVAGLHKMAAAALGESGAGEALDPLRALAADLTWRVRRAAVRAIGRLEGAQACR